MATFYANGKLLLTGEYLVVKGAKALAIPLKLGQSLDVQSTGVGYGIVHWQAYDREDKLWFEMQYSGRKNEILNATDSGIAEKLAGLIYEASKIGKSPFDSRKDFKAITRCEFGLNWGWGSSSTLISLLSDWMDVDPYQLYFKCFKGSAYDIACAKADGPILYRIDNKKTSVRRVSLNWPFADHLFLIFSGEKQDSQNAIATVEGKEVDPRETKKVSEISEAILNCRDLERFGYLVMEHEQLLAKFLNQSPLKDLHFQDYPHPIKSLGAWGGDFFLAIGNNADMEYFKEKGLKRIYPLKQILLDKA